VQLGLVAAVTAMVGGFAITPSYGQATTSMINFVTPFASSGLPLCGGEEVAFSGNAHFLFRETITPNGMLHTTMHMNYMDSAAVGLTSGAQYQINEVDHHTVNQRDLAGTFHTTINGNIVGPVGVNTGFHMVLQTVLDANGEPITTVEHVETRCVG
jgi:hypothetical protein